MSIPIYLFLIFFGVVALFFLLFGFFNVFHAIRYGMEGPANTLSIAFFGIGSLIFLIISVVVILSTDWSLTLDLFGSGSLTL